VLNEAYTDKRFRFLAAIVEAVGRKVGTSAVKPEDIGDALGLSGDEIQEYTTYWKDKGCLSLTMYRVAITADGVDTVDEAEAIREFAQLRQQYIEGGYPNHKNAWFRPDSERADRALQRLAAEGLVKMVGSPSPDWRETDWRLTDLGQQRVMSRDAAGPGIAIHVGGDLVQGSKNIATITGSTLGAVAVGDGAVATNAIEGSAAVTQEQLRSAVREAQIALLDDQDALDSRQYEALDKFFRVTRYLQVEQKSLAEVQSKLKVILDKVWAKQLAPELRSKALPGTLKVIEAMLKSPILVEIAKQLISHGV
jgi:hypothetical protein